MRILTLEDKCFPLTNLPDELEEDINLFRYVMD